MIARLEKIIEALRSELEQYGEMLALLDQQRQLVSEPRAEEILNTISAINAQSATIQGARQHRQSLQRELAQALDQPNDSTFSHLIPLLPEPYRPLVNALVQENNELLLRVRERAQQNQSLLHRSLELMQRFITTLSPQDPSALANEKDTAVLTVEPGSALYAAIV